VQSLDDGTFTDWLRRNPPPDLQALAAAHGGLGLVPAADCQAYARDYEIWLSRYRARPTH
jgi:hypothetical protein